MKLRSRVFAGSLLLLSAWIGSNGEPPTDKTSRVAARAGSSEDSGVNGNFESTSASRRDFEGLRARADAAEALAMSQPERFETRVGPQPWPEDLPSKWPQPPSGRVVADARRAGGERLLLIDVPGPPGETRDAYRRALRIEGYEVGDAPTSESGSGLRARRGRDEAVLRFFDRDERTRIEILFAEHVRG